jgi:HD-GYP domain-containing protein (c-di-GMP phosphodiesterase class II)
MVRKIIEELKPGMVIMQNLYDKRLNVLVKKGTEINFKITDSIYHYGYRSVYVNFESINSECVDLMPYDDVIALSKILMKTEIDFKTYIKKREYGTSITLYKKFVVIRNDFVLKVHKIAEDVIYHLRHHKITRFLPNESKSLELYSVQHAIYSSVLAVQIGLALSLTMIELRTLFFGTIIMEFSNLITPKEVLNKSGSLTEEELSIIKKHTTFFVAEFDDCDKAHHLTRLITQQHHERFDGTGYPLGLKGNQIHPLSQIAMIADAYDALISDRYHRGALTPFEAVSYFHMQRNKQFNKELVEILKRIVIPYNIGDRVMTNVGEGVIEGFDGDYAPIIRLTSLKKTLVASYGGGVSILN